MPFPRDRLIRAGASDEQLSALQEDYDALSAEAQASYDARFAPCSDYELSAQLLAEPPAEPDQAEEAPEPDVPDPPITPDKPSKKSSSPPDPDAAK